MGAGAARTAGLARAATAACALFAAPGAMIAAPAWQYSVAASTQHEPATRIATTPVSADISDTRLGAAVFAVAAQPSWVDHGSSCPTT